MPILELVRQIRCFPYILPSDVERLQQLYTVSSDSIVKGIIDDIVNKAVKTAEVDKQKTKYLQHFINKHDTIVSN